MKKKTTFGLFLSSDLGDFGSLIHLGCVLHLLSFFFFNRLLILLREVQLINQMNHHTIYIFLKLYGAFEFAILSYFILNFVLIGLP